MRVADDMVVTLSYRCWGADGRLLTDVPEHRPLSYVHGHGRLLPALEDALAGCEVGAELAVELLPEQAYGPWHDHLDVKISWAAFTPEHGASLLPGERFRGTHPDEPERALVYRVIAREPDGLVATANHPLAGESLHFSLHVLAVRPAAPQEMAIPEDVDQPEPVPGLRHPPQPRASGRRFS
ncbi:MAG: FKBP-type peptidyl-prolyl cis-trans isomerase [Planctomycetota bacterium]